MPIPIRVTECFRLERLSHENTSSNFVFSYEAVDATFSLSVPMKRAMMSANSTWYLFYVLFGSLKVIIQMSEGLVAGEDVAGVDFAGNVGEACVIAVGEDGLGEALELGEVVDHTAAEEGGAVFERRLVYDDSRALCLDALHHALYR